MDLPDEMDYRGPAAGAEEASSEAANWAASRPVISSKGGLEPANLELKGAMLNG